MESDGDGGRRARQRLERPVKKVQVVYYLSRNGQLEHPHYIELPSLPGRQLRLRDVMERLTLLRGEAMPAHFSWSCKRSYKNGYVWNDLAEDDVIYPTDGVEYVLKGSEIIPGVPVGGRRQKPLPVSDKSHLELEEAAAALMAAEEESTRHSECSRGAATDAIERVGTQTELPLDDSSSPPSTTSSDKPTSLARGSVLLQIIACGSAAMKGGRTGGGGAVSRTTVVEEEELRRTPEIVRFSRSIVHPSLKKSSSCHEEIFNKTVQTVAPTAQFRFLSVSRSSKARIEERKLQAEEGGEAAAAAGREGVRGKCIPGRRKSSGKQSFSVLQ